MSASQSDGRSKPDPDPRPPSSRGPVHLRREVGLGFQPRQLISFHLSPKRNTHEARRAGGPRLMGLLKLRGKTRDFLPPPPLCSSLPLSLSLSAPSVCSAVPLPERSSSSSSSSSSFLTVKCRKGLEETRLELIGRGNKQARPTSVSCSQPPPHTLPPPKRCQRQPRADGKHIT